MAQSPDGTTIVSAAADETLRFWRILGYQPFRNTLKRCADFYLNAKALTGLNAQRRRVRMKPALWDAPLLECPRVKP